MVKQVEGNQESSRIVDPIRTELPDPAALKGDEAILSAYFSACRGSYLSWPGNERERAYLESNRELFRISSYFDVPRNPKGVLANWGLPENLRGFIHLDERRKEALDYVISAPPERNIVLIGDPGVGKTVILFAILEETIKKGQAGIISTCGLSEYHRSRGIRLFYDDLPENPELAEAIERASATGIIATAREQDFKCRLSPAQQAMFEKVYIRGFSESDIETVAKKLLDMQGISADTEALKLLVDYAQDSPVYVWSVVRDITNSGQRRLNEDYLRENASRGMVPYVSQVMMRLLRDGERFKPGGLHTLTMLVFMATQMRDRRCHSLHFRKASDILDEHTTRVFAGPEGNYNVDLQTHALEYLSGRGNTYRFPHDCWADILTGQEKSVFTSRIDQIQHDFEFTGLFEAAKIKALAKGWADIKPMYIKRPDRFRESFLEYAHMALLNHELKDLEAAGIQIEQLRQLLAREQGNSLAELSLSIIDRQRPLSAAQIINIQDSVIMKSQIGIGTGGAETPAQMTVKDSVVTGASREDRNACPACGNIISTDNKILKCKECGTKICTTCEGWIDKKAEHQGRKITTRFPLCEKCHSSEAEDKVAGIERLLGEERKAEEERLERERREAAERKEKERREKEEAERRRQDEERRRAEEARRIEEEKILYCLTTTSNAVEKQRAWARKADVPGDVENSIGMKLKLIPAGEFMMGDSSKHKVKLTKPFYIGIYPVTQKEWKKVMGDNPSYFKGDDLPVENVSWHDCQEFINKLNAMEGTRYRLPSEAEWEYACRAGSTTKYCFGDDDKQLGEYAWYDGNSGVERYTTVEEGLIFKKNVQKKVVDKSTHDVGQKKPNGFGLYDMHGNVWEWCEDWYGAYPSGEAIDPTGASSGSDRVLRGGGWDFTAEYCASAFRGHYGPAIRYYGLGFRLARSL